MISADVNEVSPLAFLAVRVSGSIQCSVMRSYGKPSVFTGGDPDTDEC
jgi:hypothetical protein